MTGFRLEGGRTCVNCGEPLVRMHQAGNAVPSRWLHTPDRLPCVDGLTRELLGTDAEPAEPRLVVRPWLARMIRRAAQ